MSDHPVRRVSKFVQHTDWALLEDKLDVMCQLLNDRMHGVVLTPDEVQARIGAGPLRGRETTLANAVAVVPLYGVLSHRMNMMAQISGGTSTTQFVDQVRQAAADPAVKAIVIDCDSPGGSVSGLREAAAALAEIKGKGGKRIVAVANVCMASAAYWLLSQCDELVATPSAIVGSIGVLAVHSDLSEANTKAGFKPTYITAGKHKAEANEDQPLSDEARANIQRQVDRTYAHFLKAVAKGRGVSVATVENTYGQGRVFDAEDALAVKMVDAIATLDETISRLMGQPAGAAPLRGQVASANGPALLAGVVPKDVSDKLAPKDTPWSALTLADFTDQPWDSLSDGEKRHIAGHFAWAAQMPPDTFGDLKLGHHRPSDGAVVFRGVTSALGRLDQTKLPAGDAAKVRAHLEKHEAAFEKADTKSGALAAASGPADDPMPQCVDPDEDGDCPDGYSKGDDGLCYLDEPTKADPDEMDPGEEALNIMAAQGGQR